VVGLCRWKARLHISRTRKLVLAKSNVTKVILTPVAFRLLNSETIPQRVQIEDSRSRSSLSGRVCVKGLCSLLCA
jgi:hypothetical protein